MTAAISMQMSAALPGHAKVWTIETRQAQLMKDINYGQRTKLLNKKEADRLRKDLAKFVKKKKKLKSENNDKLTPEATAELQKDLDSISEALKESKSNGK